MRGLYYVVDCKGYIFDNIEIDFPADFDDFYSTFSGEREAIKCADKARSARCSRCAGCGDWKLRAHFVKYIE